MKKANITAIILLKNDQDVIEACIKTLFWCEKIIVINNNSQDDSLNILKSYEVEIINFQSQSFSELRNHALGQIKTEWLLYIDPDERITPKLQEEILTEINKNQVSAYSFLRKNICFGKEFRHGGWERDQVTRLFKTNDFKGWQGDIHESPILSSPAQLLKQPLIHHTHRNNREGLMKTIEWTKIEAQLLADSGIKPVTFLTLIRKGAMEFYRRALLNKGYKDGFEGLMEALIQAFNKIIIYSQVWEFQQRPSLKDKYRQLDETIIKDWSKKKEI